MVSGARRDMHSLLQYILEMYSCFLSFAINRKPHSVSHVHSSDTFITSPCTLRTGPSRQSAFSTLRRPLETILRFRRHWSGDCGGSRRTYIPDITTAIRRSHVAISSTDSRRSIGCCSSCKNGLGLQRSLKVCKPWLSRLIVVTEGILCVVMGLSGRDGARVIGNQGGVVGGVTARLGEGKVGGSDGGVVAGVWL